MIIKLIFGKKAFLNISPQIQKYTKISKKARQTSNVLTIALNGPSGDSTKLLCCIRVVQLTTFTLIVPSGVAWNEVVRATFIPTN